MPTQNCMFTPQLHYLVDNSECESRTLCFVDICVSELTNVLGEFLTPCIQAQYRSMVQSGSGFDHHCR